MQKTVGSVIALAILVAGCSSKSDVSERNFAQAINAYLAKGPGLCLEQMTWPVDIPYNSTGKGDDYTEEMRRRVVSLEAAGLARSEDAEAVARIFGLSPRPSDPKVKVRRYVLTDAAKPFRHDSGSTLMSYTTLCWGRRGVDKIVKWQGPLKFGEYQEAYVTYLYKVTDQADWARRADVRAAFPLIDWAHKQAGNSKEMAVLKLTNQGWEAHKP